MLLTCSGLSPLRHIHPQTPTTTPLHGRVAEDPHIAYRHHGSTAMTRESDEGRAVGTLFVGSAPIPNPTDPVWGLRIAVLGADAPAPVVKRAESTLALILRYTELRWGPYPLRALLRGDGVPKSFPH